MKVIIPHSPSDEAIKNYARVLEEIVMKDLKEKIEREQKAKN
jgi:hypothetical protein